MRATAALVAALPLVMAGVAKPVEESKRDIVSEALGAVFPEKRSLTSGQGAGPPPGLPECATENDKKYQPGARKPMPTVATRATWIPRSVYSRARCNNGWCAYMYDYYFEKDVATENIWGPASGGAGHRYDWEHAVVFVKDDEIKYVAVSVHGGWDIKKGSDVRMEGTHVKIVYHKDAPSTHALRHAHPEDDDDGVENHKGKWFRGALLGHYGWPNGELRDKMYYNNWGEANIAINDDNFPSRLRKAMKGGDIDLDPSYDNGDSPGQPECSL